MQKLESVRRELAVVESLLAASTQKTDTHRLLLELKQSIERQIDSMEKAQSAAAAAGK